jgi:hypothetical protein
MHMPKKAIGFDAVRKIALTLPDVEESTAYGSPALKLRGHLFAGIAINKAAEPNSLMVRMPFEDRDALIAEQPDVYYLVDHYVPYPCVLARLARVDPETLRDLLLMGWRSVSALKKRPARTRRPK